MAARHSRGTREQEKVQVPHPFVEGHGVYPLGGNYSFDRLHRCAEHRAEGFGLLPGKLAQRFTVPPALHDQLAGVGKFAGVVTDEPEPIVEDYPAGRRMPSGDFGAGAALRMGSVVFRMRRCGHASNVTRSVMIQTLVAKKNLIMVV